MFCVFFNMDFAPKRVVNVSNSFGNDTATPMRPSLSAGVKIEDVVLIIYYFAIGRVLPLGLRSPMRRPPAKKGRAAGGTRPSAMADTTLYRLEASTPSPTMTTASVLLGRTRVKRAHQGSGLRRRVGNAKIEITFN